MREETQKSVFLIFGVRVQSSRGDCSPAEWNPPRLGIWNALFPLYLLTSPLKLMESFTDELSSWFFQALTLSFSCNYQDSFHLMLCTESLLWYPSRPVHALAAILGDYGSDVCIPSSLLRASSSLLHLPGPRPTM